MRYICLQDFPRMSDSHHMGLSHFIALYMQHGLGLVLSPGQGNYHQAKSCGWNYRPWRLQASDDCNLVRDQFIGSSSSPDCYMCCRMQDRYGLEKKRKSMCLIFLCSFNPGDSIRLAPEDISLQLLIGRLAPIKMHVYICCAKLLRKDLLHNCCYRQWANDVGPWRDLIWGHVCESRWSGASSSDPVLD